MNDPKIGAELFGAVQSLSAIVPEMRAGQLMAALGELCADLHGQGLWEAEDEDFLEAIWRLQRGVEEAALVRDHQNA